MGPLPERNAIEDLTGNVLASLKRVARSRMGPGLAACITLSDLLASAFRRAL